MLQKHALVVLSGGQDSTTCLFWALQNYSKVSAVTFDYGQRHRRELHCAASIAYLAQRVPRVEHEMIQCMGIMHSTSPLVDVTASLENYTSYEQMDQVIGDRTELTFVPMRNALFLTIAANRAVELGGADIVTGVCQMDNANYPDCRLSFIRAQEEMINQALGLSDGKRINIVTPLINMSKAESVHLALHTPDAYEALALSHTSYDGMYPPVGMNHANVLRAQGFLEADYPDPLVLRAVDEGHMTLPDTENYNMDRMHVVAARARVRIWLHERTPWQHTLSYCGDTEPRTGTPRDEPQPGMEAS